MRSFSLFIFNLVLGLVSSYSCNDGWGELCSGNGVCQFESFCNCFPGYGGKKENDNKCDVCKSCDRCSEFRACTECMILGTGPLAHLGQCGDCLVGPRPITNASYLEDMDQAVLKSASVYKESCQMVTAGGCQVNYGVTKLNSFWDGQKYQHPIYLWLERDSMVCPSTSEEDLAKVCNPKATCGECESTVGCGWCSDPSSSSKHRCTSKAENQRVCPEASRQEKASKGPVILKETREQRHDGDWVNLRPTKVELAMSVGDVKYLEFHYGFFFNRLNFTHNFPEGVEVKIFSTCDGHHPFQEITECDDVLNGHVVNFVAQIKLNSCPKNAGDWSRQYEIRTSEKEDWITIDFTAFCSCSCDKAFATEICRNDKKSFLDLNPCSKKHTCAECLRDVGCNWCSSPQYSYPDKTPAPRCNNDAFFTSDLCPEEGKLNPAKALSDSEDCTNCDLTCSGGVCSEKEKDLLDSNPCVSHLTCGDCIHDPSCGWCPSMDIDGSKVSRCNLLTNWAKGKGMVCKEELFKDRSKVPLEKGEFFTYEGEFKDYEDEDNKVSDNAMDIVITTGRKYNIQLTWNHKAAKTMMDKSLWEADPDFQKIKLIMKSDYNDDGELLHLMTRNFISLSKNQQTKKEWDLIEPYVIDRKPDHIDFNISVELSEDAKESLQGDVYILILNDEQDPLAVFKLSVEAVVGCECEKECSVGSEKYASSCSGGHQNCGICQECPEGRFGEFCECGVSPSLHPLPALEFGSKDSLAGTISPHSEKRISFSHAVLPLGVSPDILACNATYCKNTNRKECNTIHDKDDARYDDAVETNMVTIFGDQRILPGAELEFRFTFCKLGSWGSHRRETVFGFGSPVTKENKYELPKRRIGDTNKGYDIKRFLSDNMNWWAIRDMRKNPPVMEYHKSAWGYKENYWSKEKEYGFHTTMPKLLPKVDFEYDRNVQKNPESAVKLTGTKTGVVWSWDGTTVTHPLDLLAEQFYPVFILPGCNEEEEFSSVKILSSKTGKA